MSSLEKIFSPYWKWELATVAFALCAGSLLHFVYEWSGGQTAVGLFAPISESVWEHLKLLFFPLLFLGIVEFFAVGRYLPHFLPAKTIGIVLGMAAILVSFYTYTGIAGTNFLWADILTFVFGVAVSAGFSLYFLYCRPLLGAGWQAASLAILAVCTAAFFVFSFYPPPIALFQDPVSQSYIGMAQA